MFPICKEGQDEQYNRIGTKYLNPHKNGNNYKQWTSKKKESSPTINRQQSTADIIWSCTLVNKNSSFNDCILHDQFMFLINKERQEEQYNIIGTKYLNPHK